MSAQPQQQRNFHLHSIKAEDILIPKYRQRKEFKPEHIVALAGSISRLGLMHPVVVRRDSDGEIALVAGECRIRALTYLWNFGEVVRCGQSTFSEGTVPCIYFGDLDPVDAMEMELEENIRRSDLTWQEKADATSKLLIARQARATRDGTPQPTIEEISSEVRGDSPTSREQTRKEILVSKHLSDPEVQKAKSADDAFKLLKRREAIAKNAELAAKVGVTFNSEVHTLLNGDVLELLPDIPKDSFDVLLTDPPYGIDADKFGDSGGIAGSGNQGSHFYDDSWTYWNKLVKFLAAESFRVCKPQSHCYVFCDIDNFVFLKSFFIEAGWRVFRTPLVWVNPTSNRAPWPEHGPQRKYQIAMFAVKGDRPVTKIYPDVLVYPSDENLNHQAQKPVALYQDLLVRSIRPGDSVLDCFGGTGPIIPAAHALKCKATYIERDPAAYGTAITRLKGLE
jgi:site-specific DNA-methyltransferase (adenine-specific)